MPVASDVQKNLSWARRIDGRFLDLQLVVGGDLQRGIRVRRRQDLALVLLPMVGLDVTAPCLMAQAHSVQL